MIPAEVSSSHREVCIAGDSWWLASAAYRSLISNQSRANRSSAFYQFGDAALEIISDDPAVLGMFGTLYGDCAIEAAKSRPVVRCGVERWDDPPLLLLNFRAGRPQDPAAAALGLLRGSSTPPPYAAFDSTLKGWRLVGGETRPLLAVCGDDVLIDRQRVTADFFVEYLVAATLAAQPGLLALHAASLSINGEGVLLSGASHSGKTTTSLHLAVRGHTLLGDEVAAIRLENNVIVPLRRAVNLRRGPRTPELAWVLREWAESERQDLGGGWTSPIHIRALFPDSPATPAKLRAIFFLSGFAAHPSCVQSRFTLEEMKAVDCLSSSETAHTSWGLSPARRTLRLLALKQVLEGIPCWWLTVGPPLETVELIEGTLEERRC